MFGDSFAIWIIVSGIILVLAAAALVFMIAWRLTARRPEPPGQQITAAERE